MTTQAILDRIEEIELTAIPPAGTIDVSVFVVHTPGERLPDGNFSGIGGRTQFGVGWFDSINYHPIDDAMFDTPQHAQTLADRLMSEEGELWQRKEARRARIRELEAAEAAAEKDAASGGAGSRARSRSSARHMASTGTATGATPHASQAA